MLQMRDMPLLVEELDEIFHEQGILNDVQGLVFKREYNMFQVTTLSGTVIIENKSKQGLADMIQAQKVVFDFM